MTGHHSQATWTHEPPWHLGPEPRANDAPAIYAGIYNVLTVGPYFDGGIDEQERALALIVEAVNSYDAYRELEEAACILLDPDTITGSWGYTQAREKARAALDAIDQAREPS